MIGGGIIGLEMATVYDALGAKVTVVETLDQLMPGRGPRPREAAGEAHRGRYEKILLGTKVAKVEALPEGLRVTFETPTARPARRPQVYDRVLVAVGRRPNGRNDRRRGGRRAR